MRCIWAIVVLWACYYTSNTRAQQCVSDLFPPLPAQPSYSGLSPTYDAIGALSWWYDIAESFVDALWPDIPYEEINLNGTVITNFSTVLKLEGTWSLEFLKDWGKSVLALFIIGLLLAICVPVAGICVCCCRCRGFCGGSSTKEYKPKRYFTFITALLILIVFAGLVIAYMANTNARVAVNEMPEKVDSALEDVQTYLATLQRDLEFVGLEQYGATADCVVESVGNSFTSVLDGVARDLNVDDALNLADQVVTDVDAVNVLLLGIKSGTMQLSMTESMLLTELTSITGNLMTIKNDSICPSDCDNSLTLNVSAFAHEASMVPNISTALMNANTTLHDYDVRMFISSTRMKLNSTLHDISMQVEEMKQDVSDLLKGTIQDNINSSFGQLTRSLDAIVTGVELTRNNTKTLFSSMAALPHGPTTYLSIANDTRFALCFCFCTILLLILLLAIIGLLCGSCGVKAGEMYSPQRNRIADHGGRCLLASSGCIFLWWFLLMMVVTFAFLSGAILQIPCDEVEHPSYNGIVKTFDDPEVSRRLIGGEFGMLLQMDDISFREMLLACSQNQSLYIATGLDRILLSFGIDLNGLFNNATELIEELQTNTTSRISTSIAAGTVTILSGTTLMELQNIQSFNLNSVNVSGVVAGYSSVLDTVDLDMLLSTLQGLQTACSGTSTCLVESEIDATISSVTSAQTTRASIVQLVTQLSSDFNEAKSLAMNISNTVGMLIVTATAANASLSDAIAIEASTKAHLSELFGIGVQYIQYLNTTLVNSVAPCYAPWAAAVGTTSHICTGIVGSLNAYWFALGWSLLWCLPLIVFMIWLAGYFVNKDDPSIRLGEIVPDGYEMSDMARSHEEDEPAHVNWTSMPRDPHSGMEEECYVVKLSSNGHEYKDIAAKFNSTMVQRQSHRRIVKIERIQNPTLYAQYTVKKRSMETANVGRIHQNERRLFHGCALSAVTKINHGGFNRSYAGAHGTAYGKGTYFARDASYSSSTTYAARDDNGHQHMYLARVLTGVYTTGQSSFLEPPPKDPRNPVVLYDSVVDNVQNPTIFVIFHDAQAYPEYHIEFC